MEECAHESVAEIRLHKTTIAQDKVWFHKKRLCISGRSLRQRDDRALAFHSSEIRLQGEAFVIILYGSLTLSGDNGLTDAASLVHVCSASCQTHAHC